MSNKKYNCLGFIKIGKDEHIDLFQQEGLIHSRTLKFFRQKEIEEHKLRRDSSEGAESSIEMTNLELYKDGIKVPMEFIRGRANFFDPNLDLTHIYCLYSITPDFLTGKPFIDKRNIGFGDSALIINNPIEFVQRIQKHSMDICNCQFGPVDYYEEVGNYNKLTIFHKPKYFSFQNEFRFYFDIKDENPLEFRIGSIEDISTKISSSILHELTIKSASA